MNQPEVSEKVTSYVSSGLQSFAFEFADAVTADSKLQIHRVPSSNASNLSVYKCPIDTTYDKCPINMKHATNSPVNMHGPYRYKCPTNMKRNRTELYRRNHEHRTPNTKPGCDRSHKASTKPTRGGKNWVREALSSTDQRNTAL